MYNFLKNLLGSLFFHKELDELKRYRVNVRLYYQWLAEFPEIKLTLENLTKDISGKFSLSCNRPPNKEGPWDIVGLRLKLREIKQKQLIQIEEKIKCQD